MTAVVMLSYTIGDITNIYIVTNICLELRVIGNNLSEFITEEHVKNIKEKVDIDKTQRDIKAKLRDILEKHNYLIG